MNHLTTIGSGPFDPNLRMSSVEIAELMGKQHGHVMRDIRDLIETGAIDRSSFGEISYLDSMNREQVAYELDFEATLVLITGYDPKRRAEVIRRWKDLETGKALPHSMANASALDAMTRQLVEMIVPAVIERATKALMGQLSPELNGLKQKMDKVQINFSHCGTVWSFASHCLQEGGYNTYVLKDELYEAYCAYCGTIPYCRAEGKTAFLSKLYGAFVNTQAAYINLGGRKVPAVRGMGLLPGYKTIIQDLRARRQEKDAQELARRREEYLGISEKPEGLS
jgi:hypothetical protein